MLLDKVTGFRSAGQIDVGGPQSSTRLCSVNPKTENPLLDANPLILTGTHYESFRYGSDCNKHQLHSRLGRNGRHLLVQDI